MVAYHCHNKILQLFIYVSKFEIIQRHHHPVNIDHKRVLELIDAYLYSSVC